MQIQNQISKRWGQYSKVLECYEQARRLVGI